MGRHMDAVTRFLSSIDFKYQVNAEKGLVHMGFSGDSGSWTAVADVKEDRGILVFYSIGSIKVPEPARVAAAEYLTRANYNLILGNFELDMSDGEVRYKTSLSVGEKGVLTDDLIRPVVLTNFGTMDKYMPGLLAVAMGGKNPAEAVREAEAKK